MRSKEQGFIGVRGLLIWMVRILPALVKMTVCPGCISLMDSMGTLNTVWMTGRSLARTATSSS